MLKRNKNIDTFEGSANYWESRYKSGRSSGAGSFGRLAEFKASVLNDFVKSNKIRRVIEFGCGDGNQLSLAIYPEYVGFDVSSSSISICTDRFRSDPTKSFFQYLPGSFSSKNDPLKADLVLSLDVIFHLVEEDVFGKHMQHIFGSSSKFVIIYSSNEEHGGTAVHVRHRKFTDWIDENKKSWKMINKIKNPFPYSDGTDPNETSFADFYIFAKSNKD